MSNTLKNGKESVVQHCEECNVRLTPIFAHDPNARNAEDWFWLECSECEAYVCDKCTDEVNDNVVCTTCLQHPKYHKNTGEE